MNIEQLHTMSKSELRQKADACFVDFEVKSSMEKEHSVAEAQFYLAEIERRTNARVSLRDLILEIVVIILIGLELVVGYFEGEQQANILNNLNKSSAETADTLAKVRQAQEASLETQKHTLDNIVAMNTALQDEMGLNYAVSLAITYDDAQSRINLFNQGKTNLFLWGDKLDGQGPVMEKEPRIITPGGFYYLDAKSLKKELIEKVPKGSRSRLTFDAYLKTAKGKKYISKSYFMVAWENDTLKVDTQTISVTPSAW